ncbi:MAG TPA: GNAT family N-acetyltransferase [Solirubrobacteraceae bacterium]|nr:GNAT family N-acetyltransferase [Solirubrobacteraceae bacterium]
MGWRFTDDPEAFAERVWDLLAADPARHTVSLTVAAAARSGFRWSDDPMLFGWYDDGGEVRGAVSLTPPHELLLAEVPEGSLDELIAGLREQRAALPGVNGEVELVDRFVAAWAAGTPLRHRVTLRLRLFRLGTLVPPDPSPAGTARVATLDDLELAIRWLRGFEDETGVTRTNVEAGARERLDDGRLWLWLNEAGEPASLAARTATAVGVSRVAPVYTPPEHRRRGYGAAITAAITADALERDAEHVVLFTDVENPTTNAIYQQIGFRPLGDRCTVQFSD